MCLKLVLRSHYERTVTFTQKFIYVIANLYAHLPVKSFSTPHFCCILYGMERKCRHREREEKRENYVKLLMNIIFKLMSTNPTTGYNNKKSPLELKQD